MLGGLWAMMLPGFLATYSRYLWPEAVELIEEFGPRIPRWVDDRDGPLTVTHGDYRLDNLMFRTDAGGYPVAAVDWQTPGHGPALGDVSYFLGAGLLPEARRQVERPLLDEYVGALGHYGVHVDEAWLWHHYRRDAFGGLIMAVVASQIVGASERSEAMFAAMATRHCQQALDLGAMALV
jgi:aminoglycoside phosphotransferase (APT) family kinase protein